MRLFPKIFALFAMGVFGFILWFHIDYAIRYYDMMNGGLTICFGYPIWIAYASIALSLFTLVICYFLFTGKIKAWKALFSFIGIGITMVVFQSGLLQFLFQ